MIPVPNGIPARIGTIQCTDVYVDLHSTSLSSHPATVQRSQTLTKQTRSETLVTILHLHNTSLTVLQAGRVRFARLSYNGG